MILKEAIELLKEGLADVVEPRELQAMIRIICEDVFNYDQVDVALRQESELPSFASERIADIPWMTLCKPRGTFYLFPGIEKTGLTDTAFCQMALEKAHVLLSPGHLFGSCGQGHIRIAATQPLPRLEEAMDRLSALSFPG